MKILKHLLLALLLAAVTPVIAQQTYGSDPATQGTPTAQGGCQDLGPFPTLAVLTASYPAAGQQICTSAYTADQGSMVNTASGWTPISTSGAGPVTQTNAVPLDNKSINGATNTLTNLPAAALTGTVPAAALPNPSATALGGTQSITCGSHTWISVISISGVPFCTQPAFSDISGSAACSQLPALTGNVTMTAGQCATVIPSATVTLAMQANLAANSIEGNNTGSPAAPIALTVAQVKTMVGITTGSFTATGTGLASPGTATGVAITGTAGQFSCTCSGVAVGQVMAISGTFGGTGSITGYANPTTYYVSATNGISTFTLQTLSQGAIVTTSGTPTGLTYTLGVAGTINYSINGNQVMLTAYAAITGTSSSTSMTLNNLPAAVQPVHAKDIVMFGLEDAGNPAFIGGAVIAAGGSVITFYMGVVSGTQVGGSSTGFTASGTKGLPAGWSITYTND